ncbi:MAG: histidine phosphatase family protein [Chloroflexi bacterium]|nr:histidine phosphatase family protein [Chloroflexota bacterium]
MRHGRSRADDEGVHEGRYDSPLTDVGREQVRMRAMTWLSERVHFDCIIASTLQRALESANIIGNTLGAPVETDPDWMELDNGPLAGMSRSDAQERYPRPAFRNPYEPFCGSGESDWAIHSRAARAVEKVIRRGAGKYLVVAHGGILNAAMRTLVGAPPSVNGQGIWFSFGDTGFVRTHYVPTKHQWVIEEFKPG